MSKAEVLPKLSIEEREEIRARLAGTSEEGWMDDGALTQAEKAIIDERFRDFAENPRTSIPWAEAKKQLRPTKH